MKKNHYTDEQQAVIDSTGDLVVNAVAGSGKTSTLIGFAERRSRSKILYLAFNKSVKAEAEHKFAKAGLANVRVETAHSLAWQHFRYKQLQLTTSNYRAFDAKRMLGFRMKDAIEDMRFGKHVIGWMNLFCNSTAAKVADVDYINGLGKEDKAFAANHQERLVQAVRQLLAKMQSGQVPMEHDFYLKLYQMEGIHLPYDHILFDEGQDASPVMLDIFLKQRAEKIIVGDEHQQIYGWRNAVNALRNAPFDRKYLNTSFRFPQEVATLASEVLKTKLLLAESHIPVIRGVGGKSAEASQAVLGRTNAAVFVEAIRRVIEEKEVKRIYFEGNFNSYTYADEGGSLYDVLNLYLGERERIREPFMKQFQDFLQLEEYIDRASDAPLKGLVEVVKQYGRELPAIVKQIKSAHVTDAERRTAEVVFSTVHKAKGMEYSTVQLCPDFTGEVKLKNLLGRSDVDEARLLEEVNILYVAITRAQNKLKIPEELVPIAFEPPEGSCIDLVQPRSGDEEPDMAPLPSPAIRPVPKPEKRVKAYDVTEKRQKYPDAYKKWTPQEDAELELLFCEGQTLGQLAAHFERTRGAIASRIKKLELREKYG